jgi:GNAT superfamily N-acetyltransferase
MANVTVVVPASPSQWGEAFRLIFQHLPEDERETRIHNALQLVEFEQIDPAGVFVALDQGSVVGALICQQVPGASGLVWPPQTVYFPERPDIEDALIRHAAEWLRGRGVKLAQCLTTVEETYLAEPLVRNGFNHITRLCYLQHDLAEPDDPLPDPKRLRFLSFSQLPDPSVLSATLWRTYEGTQDCPEITNARTLDEVMEGHRAQGQYDPEIWWVALEEDNPVGVLLMSSVPECAAYDLAYVGVVPEYRGRGLGVEIMHHALGFVRETGWAKLTLAVDGRNLPAWRLYTKLGFVPLDAREVFLAIWESPSCNCS